jgi:hypothetical protein
MISTPTIVVVLVGAFLLGVKFMVDLIKHRPRKVELGFGDVRPRGAMKEYKAGARAYLGKFPRLARWCFLGMGFLQLILRRIIAWVRLSRVT